MDFLLYFPFLAAFAIVNVSYTFWGVKNTLHGFGPPVVMYCGFFTFLIDVVLFVFTLV